MASQNEDEGQSRHLQDDREYFQRRPGRRFRLRRPLAGEGPMTGRVDGTREHGVKLVVVEQLRPGVRARVLFMCSRPIDLERDWTDRAIKRLILTESKPKPCASPVNSGDASDDPTNDRKPTSKSGSGS